MRYELSIKLSFNDVAKKVIEAKDRDELERKISTMRFWEKNRERITIKIMELKNDRT